MTTLRSLHLSAPKYVQVAEQVRAQIHAGHYRPGGRLPRVADWKRELGVSFDTMNKVLAALEQDGLITRTQGSGIYVAERALKKRRTHTGIIGVLGLDHGGERHAYWNQLLAGAQQAAREAKYNLLLVEDGGVHWERMDGVLSMGYGGSALLWQHPEPMPAAALLAVSQDAPYIEVDEGAGVSQIVEHLLNLGHRKVAYLHVPGSQLRLAAYQSALARTGIEADRRWSRTLFPAGNFDASLDFAGHAQQVMEQWLRDDWKSLGCTAIMAHNDEAAVGVLKALRAAKIEVPSQVSVTGFDGTELAAHADPPLTTLEVPLHEIGARGVELLLRQMQGETIIEHFIVAGRLHIGASTAPPFALPSRRS